MSDFSPEKSSFARASGDAFYFSTQALEARCEELCAAIARGHVLLVDEASSGKSSMLDSVVQAARDGWRIFRVQANGRMDGKDFVHELVSMFGLPSREPAAAALRDADALLEVLTAQSQLAVLVIDDVHRLERDALDQLLYLAKRWDRYAVRYLVCAEPGLLKSLESRPPAERFPAPMTEFAMPRFDRDQVNDYLHLYLFHAGFAGDSPFDPKTVAEVTEKTRGLVGAINPIAEDLLNQAASGGQNRSNGGGDERGRLAVRRWSVAALAAAALGFLLTLAVPDSTSRGTRSESMRVTDGFQSSIILEPRQHRQRRSASAAAVLP